MPIEIRELVVKAAIVGSDENIESAPACESSQLNREEIVEECVEQVLSILEEKLGR